MMNLCRIHRIKKIRVWNRVEKRELTIIYIPTLTCDTEL